MLPDTKFMLTDTWTYSVADVTYTHLTTALYYMGDRVSTDCRPLAKKVLIVATDGNSNDDSVLEDGRGLWGPMSDLQENGKYWL